MAPPTTFDPDSPFADLLALGNAGGGQGGNAPPYLIIPHIGLSEILTDNVRHTHSNRQADLLTLLQVGATVTADTTRLQGVLSYNLDWRQGLRDGHENRLSQLGYGTAHVTLVQDYLFFDLRAHTSEIDRSGLGTPNPNLATKAESTQTYVVSASPDFRTRVGNLGFADIRYSATKVWFERNTGATVINGIALGPLSDSTHQQAHADFKMPGTLDPRLLTDLSGTMTYTQSSRLLGIYRNYAATLLNEYAVTREISAIAGVGYEKLSNPRFAQLQGEGVTFDGGARWRPNADSSIMLLYGRHDLKSDIAGLVQYKYSDTTFLYGIYTDSITSAQGGVAGNTLNAAFGLDGPYVGNGFGFYENPAIDELGDNFGSGIPLGLANGFLSGQNDFYRVKSFRAHLHTAILGESIAFAVHYIDSTSLTGLRQPPQVTNEGATISWLPYLGQDYSGLLLVGYRHQRPNQGEVLNFAAGVSYHFSASFNGTLRYDFIHNMGNTNFAGPNAGGFVVNSLTLRLRKTF